jgi:hypothetical protein
MSKSVRVSSREKSAHMHEARAAIGRLLHANPAAHVIISAPGLAAVVKSWRALNKWMFDSYRPELHYMHGPGPKWREKHAHVDSTLRASVMREWVATPCSASH